MNYKYYKNLYIRVLNANKLKILLRREDFGTAHSLAEVACCGIRRIDFISSLDVKSVSRNQDAANVENNSVDIVR